MPVTPVPQKIIITTKQFTVSLQTDKLDQQDCVMRVLVDNKPQCFSIRPQQPCADQQSVTLFGPAPVVVRDGWGSPENAGKQLVVVLTSPEGEQASEPRSVLAGS